MTAARALSPAARTALTWSVRAVTSLLLSLFVIRAWQAYQLTGHLNLLLLLTAEALTVLIYLTARPATAQASVSIAITTFLATFYFLWIDLSQGVVLLPALVTQLLQTIGISLQIAAKLHLRRSFGLLPANRGVVTSGPYRWVRHPIYLGYFISHLGFLLSAWTLHNALVYVALYALQVARLLAEENVLAQSPEYRDYQQRVRYRFLPPLF